MKFAFPPLTPVVRATLIVLFASFVIQSIVQLFGVQLVSLLGLWPSRDLPLAWQWATYPLVEIPSPGSVVARAFDMLLIYSFGGYVETSIGRNKTIALTLISIPGAALLAIAFGLLFPEHPFPLTGATGIAFAMMGAFAVETRGAPVTFFLMPTMSVWYSVGVMLVIVGLQSMWIPSPIPFFAAIGGTATGALFARWTERRPPAKKAAPKRRSASHLQVIPGGQSDEDRPRWLN